MKITSTMKKVIGKIVGLGCMAASVFCITACDSNLDIQSSYPFHVEIMPVPLRVTQGGTVEIRCSLHAEGRTHDTQYTIRWFLYDGKGSMTYNGHVLKANDSYPLTSHEFRLYYTSESSDAHNFIVVVEDNHGQSQQLEFKFNNEDEEKVAVENGGQGVEGRQ